MVLQTEFAQIKNNNLYIDDVKATELAKKYGTPLYVMSEGHIRHQFNKLKTKMIEKYENTLPLFASKSFSCIAIYKIAKEYGVGIDCVSAGEISVALKSGFDPKKIYFHGNNKSYEELQMALSYGVGTIVVDNAMECELLVQVAKQSGHSVKALLRVNPGVEAHTHKYIVTAHLDSKFGTSITHKEEIAHMVQTLSAIPNIHFEGFHSHIGSQIFDANAYVAEIQTLMKFVYELQEEYQIQTKALNLGGGFAAYYTAEDKPIPLSEVCSTILDTCSMEKERYQLPLCKVMIEPGRSIVAEAGSTLYRVGFTKQTANKKYVFVDGGMSDNIRPALYQAAYACDLANRINEEKCEKVTIAGKCCESGDILIEDVMLPHAQRNDLLILYTTGAYGYSMASNYNRLGRPAVVFVKNGKARIVVKRESYEDMCMMECDELVHI